MSKREYLDRLREFLSYELPSRMVESNIRFYENYFDEQQHLGRSFQEIEEELGDPQLIARTCIDAAKSGDDGIPNSGDEPDFTEEIERESAAGKRTAGTDTQSEPRGESTQGGKSSFHVISGAGCLIPVLIFVFILVIVFSFFATPFGATVLIGLVVAGAVSALIRKFWK